MKRIITHAELLSLFSYDPDTGHLIRLKSRGAYKAGQRAGGFMRQSTGKLYRYLLIGEKSYREHRLIWFYVYGKWPFEVDHINGDGTDNRLCNLREVTHEENGKNQKLKKNNKSGVSGVHFCKTHVKWHVSIGVERKRRTIGYYDDFFSAVCARKNAEKMLGYHVNHGTDRPL